MAQRVSDKKASRSAGARGRHPRVHPTALSGWSHTARRKASRFHRQSMIFDANLDRDFVFLMSEIKKINEHLKNLSSL